MPDDSFHDAGHAGDRSTADQQRIVPETSVMATQTTPEKLKQVVPAKAQRNKRKTQNHFEQDEKFRLIEVPPSHVGSATTSNIPDRPVRHRIRTLDFWRGEKVEWERLRGSFCPTPRAVLICKNTDEGVQRVRLDRATADPLSPHESLVGSDVVDALTPPARGRGSKMGARNNARAKQAAKTRAAPARSAAGHVSPILDQDDMVSCEEGEAPEEEELTAAAGATRTRSSVVTRPKGAKGAKQPPAFMEDEEGFVESLKADGSLHPVKLRMGLSTDAWLCCDVIVPPSSFNQPETMNAETSLLINVFNGAGGFLSAVLNGRPITLRDGDKLAVLPGSEYSLKNDSQSNSARVKMVMVGANSGGA